MNSMHMNGFFEFEGAKLHWWRWGNGPKTLLAFHGFGQHGQYFHPFARAISDTHTIWSFDMFFHGQSVWPDPHKPLSREFWHRIISAFLKAHEIERFELCGYSMGGKFALATLEHAASQIDRLILVAPDGIRTSFWYSMATYPRVAKKLFRSLVEKPEPFYKLIHQLERYRLMDKGILRFADWHMSNPEKRMKVFNTWTVFSPLRFNMRYIADLIRQHHIQLEMYLGRYDKIMTPQGMQRLLRYLKEYKLEVLNTGHSGLIDLVAHQLNQQNQQKGSHKTSSQSRDSRSGDSRSGDSRNIDFRNENTHRNR